MITHEHSEMSITPLFVSKIIYFFLKIKKVYHLSGPSSFRPLPTGLEFIMIAVFLGNFHNSHGQENFAVGHSKDI